MIVGQIFFQCIFDLPDMFSLYYILQTLSHFQVLLCLASAKSIVPLQYFIDLCKALSPDSLSEVPFCMDYKPKLVESLLNPNSLSLDVNNKRKILFSGKTFICSTVNQLNRLSKLVKLAGKHSFTTNVD